MNEVNVAVALVVRPKPCFSRGQSFSVSRAASAAWRVSRALVTCSVSETGRVEVQLEVTELGFDPGVRTEILEVAHYLVGA